MDSHNYGFLCEQLSPCAHKWEEIAIGLRFKGDEIQNIKRDPVNLAGGPQACLRVVLNDWLHWAPEDARGSKTRATLEPLKTAVKKAGFGDIAQHLKREESPAEVHENSHSQSSAGTLNCQANLSWHDCVLYIQNNITACIKLMFIYVSILAL